MLAYLLYMQSSRNTCIECTIIMYMYMYTRSSSFHVLFIVLSFSLYHRYRCLAILPSVIMELKLMYCLISIMDRQLSSHVLVSHPFLFLLLVVLRVFVVLSRRFCSLSSPQFSFYGQSMQSCTLLSNLQKSKPLQLLLLTVTHQNNPNYRLTR